MEAHSTLSADGTAATISVSGKFDIASLQVFRKVYMELNKHLKSYTIDLKDAEYLDSSALGILLALREHLGGDLAVINIINCSEDIKKIFTITRLNKAFVIQ